MKLLPVIAIAASMASTAVASSYLAEFGSYSPGPIQGQEGWKQSYGDEALASIVTRPSPGQERILELGSTASTGVRIIRPLNGLVGADRQISYDVKADELGDSAATAFATHINFNNGSPKFVVSFSSSGVLTLFDGAEKLKTGVTIVAGQWYRIAMILSDDGESLAFELRELPGDTVLYRQSNLGFADGVREVATAYHDFRLLTTAGSNKWSLARLAVKAPGEDLP